MGNLSNVKLITCNLTASGKLSMYFMLSWYSPFSTLTLAWSIVYVLCLWVCALVVDMWSLLETHLFPGEERMLLAWCLLCQVRLNLPSAVCDFAWKDNPFFRKKRGSSCTCPLSSFPLETDSISTEMLLDIMMFGCIYNGFTSTNCGPCALKPLLGALAVGGSGLAMTQMNKRKWCVYCQSLKKKSKSEEKQSTPMFMMPFSVCRK